MRSRLTDRIHENVDDFVNVTVCALDTVVQDGIKTRMGQAGCSFQGFVQIGSSNEMLEVGVLDDPESRRYRKSIERERRKDGLAHG